MPNQATKQLSNQATMQLSNQATKQPSNQATLMRKKHPHVIEIIGVVMAGSTLVAFVGG